MAVYVMTRAEYEQSLMLTVVIMFFVFGVMAMAYAVQGILYVWEHRQSIIEWFKERFNG